MKRTMFLLLFVALMASTATAADIQWSGGTSVTWQDGTNWVGGVFPANDLTTDVALFDGALTPFQPTTYLETDANLPASGVAGMKFLTGGWVVTFAGAQRIGAQGVYVADNAGTIEFNHPATSPATNVTVRASADQSWYVGTGSTLKLTGDLTINANGGNWTKTGAGLLELRGVGRTQATGARNLTFLEGETDVYGQAYNYVTTAYTGQLIVGSDSGAAASFIDKTTFDNAFLASDVNLVVKKTGTVTVGGGSYVGTLTVDGVFNLPAGKSAAIGHAYDYGLPGASKGSITMTGGSITGTPNGGYANSINLWGPSITSNAASTTATIAPMIYWQGGTGTNVVPPMIHTVTVADGAPAIDLDLQGGLINYWWSSPIATDGQFVKDGAGTLRVGGDINWSGTMTVNAGTLLFDGIYNAGLDHGTGYTSVVVNSGGTLGGTGTVKLTGGNTITVNEGGTISPGASIGTLSTTSGGSVLMGGTIANPAKLDIEIDVAGNDLLAMGGALTLNNGGGPTILQIDLAPGASGMRTIVSGFSSLTGTFANPVMDDAGRVDLGGGQWGLVFYDPDRIVVADIVPEPASLSLLVLGGLALIRRRR